MQSCVVVLIKKQGCSNLFVLFFCNTKIWKIFIKNVYFTYYVYIILEWWWLTKFSFKTILFPVLSFKHQLKHNFFILTKQQEISQFKYLKRKICCNWNQKIAYLFTCLMLNIQVSEISPIPRLFHLNKILLFPFIFLCLKLKEYYRLLIFSFCDYKLKWAFY